MAHRLVAGADAMSATERQQQYRLPRTVAAGPTYLAPFHPGTDTCYTMMAASVRDGRCHVLPVAPAAMPGGLFYQFHLHVVLFDNCVGHLVLFDKII